MINGDIDLDARVKQEEKIIERANERRIQYMKLTGQWEDIDQ
jgi:hypothetical protein